MYAPEQRENILNMVDQAVADGARRSGACKAVGLAPSTLRRWRPGHHKGTQAVIVSDGRPNALRAPCARRYNDEHRAKIVGICNTPEHASSPPSQIVPKLADQGIYMGSESTFNRVLKEHEQLHRRGRAKPPVSHSRAPVTHTASAPNQVWMIDVTWLPSHIKGNYFYLYMVEDLYCRSGVHWEVFEAENSANTCQVLEQAVLREQCTLNAPVLHRDNGSVLKSYTVNAKMQALGLTSSHSRPRVSNDNAFIESFFRTLKYCPRWPSKGFATLEEARQWVATFMQWYNHEHRHSGLKYVTPSQRRQGEDKAILTKRDALYQQARAENPQRWSGATRNWQHQETMTLNPEKKAVLLS